MFAADPDKSPEKPAKLKKSLSIKNFNLLNKTQKLGLSEAERDSSNSELSPIARLLGHLKRKGASSDTVKKDDRPVTPEEDSGKTSPLAHDGGKASPLKRFLSNKRLGKVGRPSSMYEPSKLSPKTSYEYDEEGELFKEANEKYQEAKEKDAALFDAIEFDLHNKADQFGRSAASDCESWENLKEALSLIQVFRTLRIEKIGYLEKAVDISKLAQKRDECELRHKERSEALVAVIEEEKGREEAGVW